MDVESKSARALASGCLAAMLLAACTDSKDSSDATAAGSAMTDSAVADREKADAQTNLVAAVTTGKPGAPISLKFEIPKRPAVGEPLSIDVLVTPEAAGITGLQVIFQSNDGLQVRSGGELTSSTLLEAGQPIMHTVVVTPLREGIFYLSVVAVAEGSESQARTFAIPLVVGDAAALQPRKPALPPADATGERVSSMPARESGSKP